jgi:hypothetical protein
MYMVNKEWTEREQQVWQKSPAFRRQHLCSLEGPWDWSGLQVLRVPYSHGPNKKIYRVKDSYQLRLYQYEETTGASSFRLILLSPGQTVLESDALQFSPQRCRVTEDVVDRLVKIYAGDEVYDRGMLLGRAARVDWVRVRDGLLGYHARPESDEDGDEDNNEDDDQGNPNAVKLKDSPTATSVKASSRKEGKQYSVPVNDRVMAKRGVINLEMLQMACYDKDGGLKELQFQGIAEDDIDWNNKNHITKINRWRQQIYRRAGI